MQEGSSAKSLGLRSSGSAYVLDQLLAGGLLGSPRSSLERAEHARRLACTPPPVDGHAAPRSAPLQPSHPAEQPRASEAAGLSTLDFDGPMPMLSAFAAAPGAPDHDFSNFDQGSAPRLNVARASTDSALDVPGLLPSAFASVAYADAFKPPRWETKQEPQQSAPQPSTRPAVDLQHIDDSLPAIPAQHTCPCNTQVSVSPTLWRHFEPPFRLMVHLGVHTTLVEGEMTLPLGIYSSLNPRVVTTGANEHFFCMPGVALSAKQHPYKAACVIMMAAFHAALTSFGTAPFLKCASELRFVWRSVSC